MIFDDHRSGVIALALLLAPLGACSEGQTTPCTKDSDCPGGTRCGPQNVCVPKTDARPRREAGVDLAPGELGVDGPRADLPAADVRAPDGLAPDQKPAGDQKAPDAKLDAKTDAKPTGDQKPPPDGPLAGCAAVLGKGCTTSGGECGSAATCLLTSGTFGVCTCTCTLDNPATTGVNEDSCPGKPQNFCRAVPLNSGATQNYCFKSCTPKLGSSECGAPLACDPRSSGFSPKIGLGVCLLPGCSKDSECPVLTATSCTTQNPALTCAAGEVCIPLTGATTSGRCAKAGKCDLASGLCTTHTLGNAAAKVGDPCAADTDCGGNMRCQIQVDLATVAKKGGQSCVNDEECCSGRCGTSGVCEAGLCTVNHRNGYCTISGCEFASSLTIRACPSGSRCNRVFAGGLCQKSCTLSSTTACRNHAADRLGDYECRAWDNLTLGGVQIADGPVCDFGPAMPCTFLQGSSLDCSSVGDQSSPVVPNPTKMGCRSLSNTPLGNAYDPSGFCLDDTPASSQQRSPIPTL